MKLSLEPCQYHERNICLKAITNAMNKFMVRILEENNISLDLNLQVYFNIANLVRAADKEFLLIANYPKGKGIHFKAYMEVNHPGAYLFWIPNVNRNQMDIVVDTVPCLF